MSYEGRERRRKQVVRTARTAYELRGMVCVEVTDLRTGLVSKDHETVGSHVQSSFVCNERGVWRLQTVNIPQLGERLLFSCQFVTAPVESIER